MFAAGEVDTDKVLTPASNRRARPMAFAKLLSISPRLIAAGFLAGYVLLDWISFVHPFGRFGITPWNPPPGLSLVLVLLFGQRYLPLLFLAPLLADFVVRGQAVSTLTAFVTAMVIGCGYSLAALTLLRPALKFDVSLSSMRDLIVLLLVAVVTGAIVAVACVTVFAGFGVLSWEAFAPAALRYWVGDVIGIAVMTPFLLIVLTRVRPFQFQWETGLQLLSIGFALSLVFGMDHTRQLPLFYLLFLPIVWIAVRSGLEGVSLGLIVTQIGLIAGLQIARPPGVDVTQFQALMLVLTFTGLAAGVLVTERRRAELQLRLQQDAHARLARLGSMGELASALAHEINQPLMAAGTYSRIALEAMGDGGSTSSAREAANKAVAQMERASEVVRRLRSLIRLGRSERAPVALSRIVHEALELMRPEIDRAEVRIEERIPHDLPNVMADVLQVEQVLINLVRNSIEAAHDVDSQRSRIITIEAADTGSGYLEVVVGDNGPGFPSAALTEGPQLFRTEKPEGLGVGLSLSRSIVEGHGGKLFIQNSSSGASVRFTLPVAEVTT